MVLIFTAPLVGALAWFARDAFLAEEQAAHASLRSLAALAAEDLRAGAEGGVQLLAGLSHAPELRSKDLPTCSAVLAGMYKEFPQYTGILTFDPDGNLRCDALGTMKPQNFSNRAYFKASQASGRAVIGDAVFGRLTGKAVLPILLPFRDKKGELEGYLYASYNLQSFAEDLHRTLHPTAVFAVWGTDATLMARYPEAPAYIGKPVKGPLAELFNTGGKAGIGELTDIDGVNRVFAVTKPISVRGSTTWITVSMAKEDVAALAQSSTRTLISGVAAGILLAVIATVLFADFVIRRPANRLLSMARSLAKGNLSVRIGEPYPAGEMGELMRAADRIAEHAETEHAELQMLNTRLDQRVTERTAELEAANHELEAFCYSVSHDLRSPLRHMQGFADILAADHAPVLNEEGKHCVDRIHSATDRMGALIDGLLHLSRITRADINREDVDITALCNRLLGEFQRVEPNRKVEWYVQPNMIMRGDTNLLDILLQNLLSNAWKFTAKTENARIEVRCEKQGDEMICCVSDNGAGFDATYTEKLFTPFQRLHMAHEFPGTGIGLATVQRIIARLGGRAWIEGRENEGAQAYFSLPVSHA
jgi:signal transduction histidine kinase